MPMTSWAYASTEYPSVRRRGKRHVRTRVALILLTSAHPNYCPRLTRSQERQRQTARHLQEQLLAPKKPGGSISLIEEPGLSGTTSEPVSAELPASRPDEGERNAGSGSQFLVT